MAILNFYIVDVFAQKKFTGNQAIVVEYSSPLSEEEMQEIAQELNFLETTFVKSDPDEQGAHDVRIFTPRKEVHFSGHPTLAASFVINHFLNPTQSKKIILRLKSGEVVVEAKNLPSEGRSKFISKHKPVLLSDQKRPSFGKTLDRVLLSRVLNIEVDEIDNSFPIQEVSIGLGFIIVPVKTLDSMKEIHINQERYSWLVNKTDAKCILAFCPEVENDENQVHVRAFAGFYGIPEDSATGSGNGCLAAYLAKYKYFGDDRVDIKVEQGVEIGRPSQIIAKAVPIPESDDNLEFDVSIGGRVILVAKGEIYQ